jgi:hypothetical protein
LVRIKIEKPLPSSSGMVEFEVVENRGNSRPGLSLSPPVPVTATVVRLFLRNEQKATKHFQSSRIDQ